jgi:hypothetical protein
MNIPIIDRLSQMFSTLKQSAYDDACTAYMLEAIKHHPDAPTFESIASIAYRDVLEECYTYVHRDRPLQVNRIIEHQMLGDLDAYDEATESLKMSDSYYMKSIIDVREYIFN